MSGLNAILLIGGIAAFWYVARFRFGQRYGAPSISGMFRREAPMADVGLGPEAIKTLLDDFTRFVAGENSLRGLIVAGPFAARQGGRAARVTLLVPASDVAPYAGAAWLARWAYPARGHAVTAREEAAFAGGVLHHLALRGAPALSICFVDASSTAPPDTLMDALQEGAILIGDATPDAKALLDRWLKALSIQKGE